jgi:alpha-ketoglutaric semialdehyde dehydrogenase
MTISGTITGQLFIGRERVARTDTFLAVNPATGDSLQPPFSAASAADVDRACSLAGKAFSAFRGLDSATRARFLETIAEQILALGDELLERAHLETGLPLARLTGERGRTVGQLRLFADELRSGGWQGLRVDPALPDRKPLPRSDLRQRKIAIGPVAVFGASNFPLAFSVAGGDTAAAFAAGCPVVAKGHPAHPGTGELVGRAIVAAVAACDLPEGVFSLLNGTSNALGAGLVAHPAIKAVGFTGSRGGGLALMKIASERAEPIPVYAEMSSINPVILFPGALAERADALGREFVSSLTLGVGQFCTNPGLVLGIDSPDLERFSTSAATALQEIAPGVMLTPGIHAAYQRGVETLISQPTIKTVARGRESQGPHCGRAALFSISGATLLANPAVASEVFGASSVLVRCADVEELANVLDHLEGQLTATLQMSSSDHELARRLVPVLEHKAGRLLVNGWPTGVEVSHAMVHGGPYPATSDGRTTSVGTLAIERFLRPVCYQDFPDELLPEPLRQAQLASSPHRLDGNYRVR